MIALDVVSEKQADMMRLTSAALSRKGLLYGALTPTHATEVLGCGITKARKLLNEMRQDGMLKKEDGIYWVAGL